MKYEPSQMSKTRELIAEYFSLDELKSLCFDIGINDESLEGNGLDGKTRELVKYCFRHNKIRELMAVCQAQRPHAPWEELIDEYDTVQYSAETLPLVQTPRIGKKPRKLEPEEISQFLSEYPEWKLVKIPDGSVPGGLKHELYRVYEFPSYTLTMSFINETSKRVVERFNHHPRWQNAYNRLEVWSTTFNLDYQPSTRDLRLARLFEKIWTEFRTEVF